MKPAARRFVIGVMGGSTCTGGEAAAAREVGRLVAARGAVLLCGGGRGVMEEAARGAREAGGLTIGILPGRDPDESPPNSHIEVALFTGLGDGRNYVNVMASDALIAIAGAWGTLSEIALARKVGKPVILLQSWESLGAEGVLRAGSPEEAVEMAFAALQ